MTLKIGIYGGTFDPPHIGHIYAVSSAAAELKPDRLLIIPAGTPPHKEMSRSSAPAEDRLEMARLAMKNIPGAHVSDMEIRREGKSYTLHTLREIKKENPGAELFLIMGTDMLLNIEKWFGFEEIFKLASLRVFSRAEETEGELESFVKRLRETYSADVGLISHEPVEIASSRIRQALPLRGGTEFLAEDVYSYIVKRKLYDVRVNFDWLRAKVCAMVKPTRVPHIIGCEGEAVRLARRWGADECAAREAAILHDMTKSLDHGEQLRLCEKYGIMTDIAEKGEPKLLHAKTGAEKARELFCVADEVYGAICWHTTGKEDMSLLEKIIYMADYIEPNRDFDSIEKLRELAYRNLDAAMAYALELSIEDMRQRGITPHKRSSDALRWLLQ